MAVLRYTGVQTVTFIGFGEVSPGSLFTVPEDRVEAFLGRGDVEVAPEPEEAPVEAPVPVKPVKKSVDVPPVDKED